MTDVRFRLLCVRKERTSSTRLLRRHVEKPDDILSLFCGTILPMTRTATFSTNGSFDLHSTWAFSPEMPNSIISDSLNKFSLSSSNIGRSIINVTKVLYAATHVECISRVWSFGLRCNWLSMKLHRRLRTFFQVSMARETRSERDSQMNTRPPTQLADRIGDDGD